MLDYARTAIDLLGPADAAALEKDKRTLLAVSKAIEIVGEAASKVSAECRAELPHVPWRQAIGMRNRLIHGYSSLEAEVLVSTVHKDLPALVTVLERALKDTAP
jgi:uncharacterized protein with HEPN domain